MRYIPKGTKVFIGVMVVATILSAIFFSSSSPSTSQTAAVYNATTKTQQPIQQVVEPALSNNNYYVNSIGNVVHSPARTSNNSVPVGASAKCRDGSYSFSQHRSGTCSRHGGVSTWY